MRENAFGDMTQIPTPLVAGVISATPLSMLYEGGTSSGKTQALVERVVRLLNGGVRQGDVLALCATSDAAAEFASRLRGYAAGDVRVTTPRELALDVLSLPGAREATGRDARLLAPFEMDFLMEDLKTSGLEERRLRGMLGFFKKSLSELADWNRDWLVTVEEREVYGLLRSCLAFMRGIWEPELANLAARFVSDRPDAAASCLYDHVVVDDYQMLSRASQALANALAVRSIAIAADGNACVEALEACPNDAGVGEYARANPDMSRIVLGARRACAAASAASDAVAASIGGGVDGLMALRGGALDDFRPVGFSELPSADPAAEMIAVADFVQDALERGIEPDRVIVASPHAIWSRNVAHALEARGIAAESALGDADAFGGIGGKERCPAAQLLTALYLVADQADGVAWRSWMGFGDHLACSGVVARMRAYGAARRQALAETVPAIGRILAAGPPVLGADRAVHACGEALSIADGAENLAGRELIEYVAEAVLGPGAEVPAAVLELTAPLPDGRFPGSNAADLAARARVRLAAPRFGGGGSVRIAPYRRIIGTAPAVLVLCGFVNGLFPSRAIFDRASMSHDEAERKFREDACLLAAIAGKPTDSLAVSWFEAMPFEPAERLGLSIGRIRLVGGTRIALVEPSAFLDVMRGKAACGSCQEAFGQAVP